MAIYKYKLVNVTEVVVNTSKMLEQTSLHGEALVTFPNWMLELSESPRKHRDLCRCRSQLCPEKPLSVMSRGQCRVMIVQVVRLGLC